MSVSSVGMYLTLTPLRTALVGTSLLALAAIIGRLAYRIISEAAERVEKERNNRLKNIQNGFHIIQNGFGILNKKMSIPSRMELIDFSAIPVSELKDKIRDITKALKNIHVEVDLWVSQSVPSLASDINFEKIYDKLVKDKDKSLADNDRTYKNLKSRLEYTEGLLADQAIDLDVMKETYFNHLTDVKKVLEVVADIKVKLEAHDRAMMIGIGYIRALIRHIQIFEPSPPPRGCLLPLYDK